MNCVKLWHDDIRRPPDDTWLWARTNQEAKTIFMQHRVIEVSMDHDLGLHEYDPDVPDADLQRGWDTENDGVKLVDWMVCHQYLPPRITIHSWNPDGARRMADRLRDAGCRPVVKPYTR